jgi:formyltetrahydrofolate deformylase
VEAGPFGCPAFALSGGHQGGAIRNDNQQKGADVALLKPDFVLLVSCVDRKGLVAAIATSISAQDCNIVESAQFDDAVTGRFFMRVAFTAPPGMTVERFDEAFLSVGSAYGIDWKVFDLSVKVRALVMVSKGGHCLNDLLYRTATRYLPMEVTSVVSNHTTWQRRVEHEASRSTTCRSRPRPRPSRKPACWP